MRNERSGARRTRVEKRKKPDDGETKEGIKNNGETKEATEDFIPE